MRSTAYLTAALTAILALIGIVSPPVASGAHEAMGRETTQVGIVLFDGVEIIDFSAPYEVFGQAGFGVTTITRDGKPVTTAMGLKVTPDASFADAPAFDVIVVPGGDVRAAQKDAAIFDFIRARAPGARHVLSVCTGSHILAATGLLDGLEATTFHRRLDTFAQQFPKVRVIRDVRWADNGKLITSAGLSSGIDSSLHVVARLRGVDAARTAALALEYDWKPEGGFVRTKMADKYLPSLANVRWPEGTAFEQLLSVGDTDGWRIRYRVTSAQPIDAIVALAGAAIDDEPQWRRDADAPKDTPTWHRDADGRRLTLALSSEPGAGGDDLQVTLTVGR